MCYVSATLTIKRSNGRRMEVEPGQCTYIAVVTDVGEQVSVRHERQNDERHSIAVDDDADQTQHVTVLEVAHRQRLVEECAHLHHTRTVSICHTHNHRLTTLR